MLNFSFSIHDDESQTATVCNGCRITISLSADNLASSPSLRQKYFFFLRVAEYFELEGYTVEDMYDWIAEPLLSFFEELDQLSHVPASLTAFLFLESYNFSLRADGDSLCAVRFE